MAEREPAGDDAAGSTGGEIAEPGGGSEENGTVENSLTLSDALKLSGLADTGGHAKGLIQEGLVKVNGLVERRRKRRVRDGDEIEVAGERFVVEAHDDPAAG